MYSTDTSSGRMHFIASYEHETQREVQVPDHMETYLLLNSESAQQSLAFSYCHSVQAMPCPSGAHEELHSAEA